MADTPTKTPLHEARQPRRESRNRAFDVLLRSFANALGADTALLLKADDGDRPHVLAAWGRDGLEPAIPWVRGSFLGRALEPDAHITVARDPAPRAGGNGAFAAVAAIAAPVRSQDLGVGALYAGFSASPALADEELAWVAQAYAHLAALCIQTPAGIAEILASSRWDELTGCLDRRDATEALAAEVRRSQRQGHPLSCCRLDLDGLGAVNENHGRVAGNRVLAALGPALLASSRRYDVVGRCNGDGFLVVLPETSERAAGRVAQRLLAAARTAVAGLPDAALDVSIGVAEWSSGDSAMDILGAAEAALSEAKTKGGGRVVANARQRPFDGLVELAREVVRGPGPGPADRDPSTGRGLGRTR